MFTFRLILLICLTASLVCGCSQSDTTALRSKAITELKPSASEPVTREGNPWRAKLFREAAMGLDYSTGRVTIDEAVAAMVVAGLTVDDADELHDRGNRALTTGDFLQSIRLTTQAIVLDAHCAEFNETLGSALLAERKTDLAEAAFQTAIDIEPESIVATEKLALILGGRGRRELAIAEYRRLLQFDPENGWAHSRLAIEYHYDAQLKLSRQHVDLAAANEFALPPQFVRLLESGPADSTEIPAGGGPRTGGGSPEIGAQMRVDLGNDEAGNETTAAAIDGDPDVAIAGWNDYRDSGVRSGFALTFDGGQTWQDSIVRPSAPFQSGTEGDPMTCSDPRTGNLWAGAISFGSNGGVYVARLNAGDTSFQPTVMAEVTGGADKGWMAAGPDPLDSKATRMYIGYNQGLLVSTDQGDTWSGPIPLPEFGLGWLPRIGPSGELYLTYWDVADQYKVIRSVDGGASFQGPFTIATRMDVWFIDGTRFPGQFRVAPLITSAVDPDDGTLYATYADTTSISGGNSNVDIYFTHSTDMGTTWSTPTIINTDSTVPGDQFFPWIEVDENGRIHLVFYDTRSFPQNDNASPAIIEAFYSFSDDGGITWAESVLTPAPFSSADDGFGDGFIGDYLGMGVAGTTVYPCYMSTQEGIANVYVHAITAAVLPGDINRDGAVNLLDVGPFVELLTTGGYDKAADINDDNVVNLLDVGLFVGLLGG